ncbi:FliC/FljB family flagellin [Kluyvera cryocrescens]|uniref:FliC/FljB family flagellin n=1 Tax=Kluyvera cryocrescens TaxID=580 RepID=UPI002DBBCB06|nr:FliC/FljB family flagellin [Kluyvera cryocrescens]MEB7712991.1 FliC/FljB family flagellin [Kluyvera cryocrescens]
MAQVINTNSLSLITQNNINKNQSALSSSIERLSSGLRINSAKDDAAGQAIANRFTSNIKGLTQAARNANDGISLAQTTEGALSEINNNLQRVRELTVQATTGTNSDSDLASIQDEIKSRLSEIDRVSGQTQFNGVNVLAKDGSMKIQVGANDGQTISIDLKKIDSDTLGLNGFNVNGSGTITNKAATVSDVTRAGGTLQSDGYYDVKTTNTALTTADAFAKLNDGDVVSINDGANTTAYKYNAATGGFKTDVTITGDQSDTAVTAARKALTDSLVADTGKTVSGSWTTNSGTVKFDTDSDGKITIGGVAAYVDSAGNLTTNAAGMTAQATTENLVASASSALGAGGSLTFGDTTYTIGKGTVGSDPDDRTKDTLGTISYSKSVSKDVVLADTKAAGSTTVVDFNSGIMNSKVTFSAGTSTDTFKDADGAITKTKEYTTSYAVNKDTGEVTVADYAAEDSAGAVVDDSKYKPTIGATVNLNTAGKLTTDTTSEGTATKDPLAALDAAISSIDKFRSSLGAIQNRLDSAVTNLNNTTTNLSEAQSRIQDADYATEVSNMSKAQIIQQAGNSVLAKANQVPQQVLSLLQG